MGDFQDSGCESISTHVLTPARAYGCRDTPRAIADHSQLTVKGAFADDRR